MIEHFKKYIFLYTIIPLLILTVGASYYRALVSYDYLVTYEGACDPYTQSCYVYCEEDECTEPFYYTWMTREASVIKNNCADEDITVCDFAYTCEQEEVTCTIEFCDPQSELDECETLTESDLPEESEFDELINTKS